MNKSIKYFYHKNLNIMLLKIIENLIMFDFYIIKKDNRFNQ